MSRCIVCEMVFRTPDGTEMPQAWAWIQGFVMALNGVEILGAVTLTHATRASLCPEHARVWDVNVSLAADMLPAPSVPS